MKGSADTGVWLRCYPPAWRERYGEELRHLILASNGPGPLPWRVRLDLVLGGARERLRSFGLGGVGIPPERRARAGVLLVLCAWAVMLVGGGVLQRFSENWKKVTPAVHRGLPAVAYDALIVAAAIAGLAVIVGIALAIPSLTRLLRGGGGHELRGPAARAVEATALAIVASVALLIWSHQLDSAQRNGHDFAYALGFVLWGVAAIACLASWTALAVKAARKIELRSSLLWIETELAALAALGMLCATLATGVWWGALARVAPGALSDSPPGIHSSIVTSQLLLAGVLMGGAACLALGGAAYALRARPALRD